MRFPMHGSMEFEVRGQILVARIQGPWNVELVHAYQFAVQPYVQALAVRGLWALIIDVEGEALCPPDALELIRQGAQRHHSGNRRACTSFVIHPEVAGAKLMAGIWRRLYAGILPFEAFPNVEEALEWSRQILSGQGKLQPVE